MTARAERWLPTRAEAVAFIGRVVRSQWPILGVGVIFVVAFVLVAAEFWRRGSLLIGIAVGVSPRCVWCCPRIVPGCWWCARVASISRP